jgi:hypothetical protein
MFGILTFRNLTFGNSTFTNFIQSFSDIKGTQNALY